MANIDTEAKRRSVHGYTLNVVLPVADGSIGAADRAAAGWLYSGFTYDPPSPITLLEAQFHKLYHLHHNIYRFS